MAMSASSQESTSTDLHGNKRVKKHIALSLGHDNVLVLLIAFRLLNALTLTTFFQPDEYYQALEPAWQLAFGDASGAWITWEWKEHLRSAFQPATLSVAYRIAASLARLLDLNSSMHANLLLVAPKIVQALIAASGDYYTWKLAKRVYGVESQEAWMSLALTIVSPWQWFCSTRTFSNSLETTLTAIAIYSWPFHWALSPQHSNGKIDSNGLRVRHLEHARYDGLDEITALRRTIIFAVLASIIRPTNLLIWLTLTMMTFMRPFGLRTNRYETMSIIRNGIVCSGLVLVLSALVDRMFYGGWTFPPLNFFQFNILQSLAVFYGNNDWHYYLSQGFPLLMMSALPFGMIGLVENLRSKNARSPTPTESHTTLNQLAITCLIGPGVLSILAHKEVRFIYPLLPALHVLAASPLSRFVTTSGGSKQVTKGVSTHPSKYRLLTIVVLVALNLLVAIYTSLVHNAGLFKLPEYLRSEFEQHYMQPQSSASLSHGFDQRNLTFAVLMPCHSIPWRSHLQFPPRQSQSGISGWALTCEPPLGLSQDEKACYLDEADVFYEDPLIWLKKNMSPRLPATRQKKVGFFGKPDNKRMWDTIDSRDDRQGIWLNEGEGAHLSQKKRSWPDYVVFFEQLEPTMTTALRDSAYGECARFFNSHFHDDWRRTGDVIVWCLHPYRSKISSVAHTKTWYEALWKGKPKILTEGEVEQALHQGNQQTQKILGERRLK